MKDLASARRLAETMVRIGKLANRQNDGSNFRHVTKTFRGGHRKQFRNR